MRSYEHGNKTSSIDMGGVGGNLTRELELLKRVSGPCGY